MVLKAIANRFIKTKPKPPEFPKGSKFSKQEAKTLLEEAQSKVEAIESGTGKIKSQSDYGIVSDVEIPTSIVAPNITLRTGSKKVTAPKASSKTKVDEFLSEEDLIIKQADEINSEFFNYNKINASDDIIRSIEKVARQDKSKINFQKRGVQTWKETNKLAILLGQNPETLAGNLLKIRPGTALNAAEIKAAKNLLVASHKKLNELQLLIKSEGGDTTKNVIEFARQHALVTQLTRTFKGAQTEAARTLNILKEPVQEGRVLNLKLDELNRQDILMRLGGKEQIVAIADLYGRTKGISKQNAFLEKSFGSKTSDALVEIFLNNILVGGFTHVKNISGNYIFKTMQRTERLYASKMYGGKYVDGVAEFENEALAFGEHMATTKMWAAFKKSAADLKILKTNPLKTYKKFPGFESQITGTKVEAPPNAFTGDAFNMQDGLMKKAVDVFGRLVTFDRLPYKWLQNGDNFFKNKAFSSELYALAFRDTLKQIKTGTLAKNKGAEYLATLITNPPKELTQKAYESALERTFQTPLSKRDDVIGDVTKLAQGLKTVKGLNPITILTSQYFTFLRTPANIAGTAIERMPGTNRILRSYREQLNSQIPAEVEMAKAKAALGWAFLATFVPLGYFGIFSGSDVNERGRKGYPLREAANNQPKSFRFKNFLSDEIGELTGLTGSKLQLSLNGFEPAVLIASVAADLGAILKNLQEDHDDWGDIQDALAAYALSIGDNVGNSTFMQGAANLIDLISNMRMSNTASDIVMKETKNIGARIVPGTMFLKQFNDLATDKRQYEKWGLRNTDDFAKLAIEFKSMVQKFIPGKENELYLKRDWLGDPVQKFGMLTDIEERAVNIEAKKINYRPTKVRKKLMVAVDDVALHESVSVNVELLENEYALLSNLTGKLTLQFLDELLNDPSYQEEKLIQNKLARFKETVSEAKTEAKELFKADAVYQNILVRAEKLAIKQIKTNQEGKDLE